MLDFKAYISENGAESGRFIAEKDWSVFSFLGPIESWPAALKSTLLTLLPAKHPKMVVWGRKFACFFNDAFVEHFDIEPTMQGVNLEQAWPAINNYILERSRKAFQDGVPQYISSANFSENLPLLDVDILPVFTGDGDVGGITILVKVAQMFKYQKELNENIERLRLATEGTNTGTWDLDLVTRKLFHSSTLAEIFGYDKNTILPHTILLEHLLEDDRKNIVEPALKRALADGNYTYEARIITKDGNNKWVSTKGKVYFDESGKPARMFGILTDITEKQTAKQLLEKANRQFNIAMEATNMGIFEYQVRAGSFDYTDKLLSILGIDADRPIHFSEVILRFEKPYREEVIKQIKSSIKDGNLHYQAQITTQKGELKWVESYGKVYYDKHHNPTSIFGTLKDITDLKNAQLKIEESARRYQFLADAMPQFVWSAKADGQLYYWNQVVNQYTGFTLDQLLNEPGWYDTVHPEDREVHLEKWKDSIAERKPFIFEHRFRNKEGKYRWQLSRAVPKIDDAGNVELWIGTSTDIDDLKKSEQEKIAFIKMANHELKTPVTTIKGYVQLLMRSHGNKGDELFDTAIGTISNQVNKLTGLITDLLDITNIESGELPLKKEFFDIKQLAADIIETVQMTQNKHQLKFAVDGNIDNWQVHADKERISQVLINLLTNATKYSPNADTVEVQMSKKDNDIIVAVKDYGIGINKEDVGRLFERFYRVQGKDESTFPGFGIGLYIVKEIIERHNGKIWVESALEEGSTFYISLPINNQ